MTPGEKNQGEFIQDVGVGNVEVMFERWYRYVAVELSHQVRSFIGKMKHHGP